MKKEGVRNKASSFVFKYISGHAVRSLIKSFDMERVADYMIDSEENLKEKDW